MKKGFGLLIVFIALFSLSNIVVAKDKRTFTGSIDASEQALHKLVLEVPVGMVNVQVVDDGAVTYRVDVEDNSSGWSFFATDLDALVLSTQVTDQTLHLMIDEDGISQDWTLNVPKELALQLQLGVGNVDINGFSQTLSANIGVGSAWVGVNGAEYGHVSAAVGVGEIQVHGFEQGNLVKERVIVSDQLTITGTGSHHITIEIGVGDVNLSQDLASKT
ncbi:hypothetical protein [Photobacterium alginatilyticum]|uniref:Adhesin domain-containing protein n=1 Tax=Photobacterium alginatilyticum TaxID=1775171 RepID=A0ABW9YFQ4_9GAMM|nr:hypothetical protein [Photobacterium alginatilyticum]NBI52083.1 hypothetical protein [Photobacterium alginatilyticum]